MVRTIKHGNRLPREVYHEILSEKVKQKYLSGVLILPWSILKDKMIS